MGLRERESRWRWWALTLAFAGLSGLRSAFALVGAYGLVWAIHEWFARARLPSAWVLGARVPRRRIGAALLIGAGALGAASLVMGLERFASEEGLRHLDARLADRLRLERWPVLAPAVLHGDRPQTLYAASNAGSLRLRIGEVWLVADSLGHGLHRIHYDPDVHGQPSSRSGTVPVVFDEDGSRVTRDVGYAAPLRRPRAACQTDRHAIFTMEETDEVVVLSLEGEPQVVAVGDGPTACANVEDGVLVVHTHGLPYLLRMNDATAAPWGGESADALGELRQFARGSGGYVAADAQELRFFDDALRPVRRVPVARVDAVAFAGEHVVIAARQPARLLRFNARGEETAPALLLGRPAAALAADRERIFVALTDYRDDGLPHLRNHYVEDQLLEVDAVRFVPLEAHHTARAEPPEGPLGRRHAAEPPIVHGVSPLGLHVAGGELTLTFAGTNELWRVRGGTIVDAMPLPIAAPGTLTRVGRNVFVASPSDAAIAVLQTEDVRVHRLGRHEEGTVDAARRRGEAAFYESTRVGISCQSCHLHGDSDDVLRNIGGHRLAPTLPLGGIARTSPYLRDGSYEVLAELEHLAETLFQGYARDAPPRGPDLAAFVEHLPRRTVANVELQQARRGVDAFVKAECAECHAFPAFTNLRAVPLGLLSPSALEPVRVGGEWSDARAADERLDTPSLLSVAARPPFLNDGRAQTLRDVLVVYDDDQRHGSAAALSEGELDDLLQWLEGL